MFLHEFKPHVVIGTGGYSSGLPLLAAMHKGIKTIIPGLRSDPRVYITSVGLYNDTNELLAIAKLSQPILKSKSREALIKVKLDF